MSKFIEERCVEKSNRGTCYKHQIYLGGVAADDVLGWGVVIIFGVVILVPFGMLLFNAPLVLLFIIGGAVLPFATSWTLLKLSQGYRITRKEETSAE